MAQWDRHRVLAVGAHPDDIELGCGATLAVHRARGDDVTLLVLTEGELGAGPGIERVREQQDAAARLGAALVWGGQADGHVDEGRPTVEVIESVLRDVRPGVVYTHARSDTHQDHRATARATFAAARGHSGILCYEGPTTEGFAPDLYVDVDGFLDAKLDLTRAHLSQVLREGLVDVAALEALARQRGFEGRVHHAEAFEIGRLVLDLRPGASIDDHARRATAPVPDQEGGVDAVIGGHHERTDT
jgi:LmbE family N-acetylglucosaminyl deacetylase